MQGFDMWWIYLGYLVKADLPPGEFEARGGRTQRRNEVDRTLAEKVIMLFTGINRWSNPSIRTSGPLHLTPEWKQEENPFKKCFFSLSGQLAGFEPI